MVAILGKLVAGSSVPLPEFEKKWEQNGWGFKDNTKSIEMSACLAKASDDTDGVLLLGLGIGPERRGYEWKRDYNSCIES